MDRRVASDYKGLAYEHLVGLVAIGSSSLDNMLRMLLTTVTQAPMNLEADRRRLAADLRDAWLKAAKDGLMQEATRTECEHWLRETLDVLSRRDDVIHALWQVDDADPLGFQGRHLRSNRTTPDLPNLRRLVSDLYNLIHDDRVRSASTELRLARNSG